MKNNLADISDGHLYKSNDMVRLLCHDCMGCHDCCINMDESIVLDPFDICMLTEGLNKSFEDLLSQGLIELKMVEGLLLPNIRMVQKSANLEVPPQCPFLDENGRCGIHSFRPGICRLFPLGRNYDENGLSYFLLKDACSVSSRQKVKIDKWLGLKNIKQYEYYLVQWHDLKARVRDIVVNQEDVEYASAITTGFIRLFYQKPYSMIDFYSDIENRIDSI